MEQKLTVELSLAEINKILDALGSKPYVEVYALVSNIQEQAQRQLSDKEIAGVGGKQS